MSVISPRDTLEFEANSSIYEVSFKRTPLMFGLIEKKMADRTDAEYLAVVKEIVIDSDIVPFEELGAVDYAVVTGAIQGFLWDSTNRRFSGGSSGLATH